MIKELSNNLFSNYKKEIEYQKRMIDATHNKCTLDDRIILHFIKEFEYLSKGKIKHKIEILL